VDLLVRIDLAEQLDKYKRSEYVKVDNEYVDLEVIAAI
jgi:hypothetical protein